MTRLAENEKLTLSRAKAKGAVGPASDTSTISAALGAVVEALLRPMRRRAVVRRLQRLDDRMLDDIGLRRWDIGAVAGSIMDRQAPTVGVALVELIVAIAKGLRAWQARRAAEVELRNLDDRMLRDIGISRADIREVAAGLPTGIRAEEANDALEALRRWARSRAAAKDRNALDSRTLNDIGMVRGDIGWVAEDLALRSLQPANTNNASQVA